MVLTVETTDGHRGAFKVSVPVTDAELDRIKALQEMPGLEGATWTGREGGDVR